MVQLTRIYTRGGDKGETSLGDGSRVRKTDLRVEAMGAVDEANAAIGVARLRTIGEPDDMLARIQNDLFDLGADLCLPEGEGLRIVPAQVERLEREIDAMNAELQPLKSFVLPGGSPASAYLHAARTIVRRAESRVWALQAETPLNSAALEYLNRLSDHLFVLARHQNREMGDVLWVPGMER